MKNIVLVQVVDNYGPNKFLPLAISYQWLTAAQNADVVKNWQVAEVMIEKVNIKKWIQELDFVPDAVAMSCYVWNWEFNKQLAQAIKQKWPQCRTIVGGPQVSKHDPAFVRTHDYFDIAILGENEQIFQEVLLCKDVLELTDRAGIITKQTKIIQQPSRTENLDQLPSPILTGFYDDIIDKYEQQHGQKFLWQVTIETMRGCPYHCAFCDIGDSYWNKAKLFDLNRIAKEIEWMSARKIEYVSVCDSNWGMFERDYKITKWVVEAKLRTGYPKFWDVTWAKNNPERVQKIVMLDHEAKTKLFKGVTFAMQSMDPNTLKAIERFNIRDGATNEAMQFYKKHNVPTYSEIIWPLPGETLNSFKEGLQKLIDLGQRDFLMVHPLVLTYNAPMGQPDYRRQHGLQAQTLPLDTFWLQIADPDSYIIEKVDVVKSTNCITYDEMIQGHLVSHWLIVLYFYGWAHHVMNYMKQMYRINELDFVQAWITYFSTKNNLVQQEHTATKNALTSVFEHNNIWGRQILDDVYWEFKSATSIVLHGRREEYAQCLTQFLKDVYDVDFKDLVSINMDACVDWRQSYPIYRQYDAELIKTLYGIESGNIKIDHWDQTIDNDTQFVKVAYHYQRKNRYWKCLVESADS